MKALAKEFERQNNEKELNDLISLKSQKSKGNLDTIRETVQTF